jgi:hypothetical protein
VEKSGDENQTIENDATVNVTLDFELGFSNGAEITRLEIKCKYSKRRRSNVAVILVRIVFISPFFF